MKNIFCLNPRVLIALLFLVACSTAPAAQEQAPEIASPVTFSKEETAKLLAGFPVLKEIPDSPLLACSGNPWTAAILVKSAPLACAGVLLEFQKHPRIFSKVKETTVAGLGESRYRVFTRVRAGLFQFRYTALWAYQAKDNLARFDLDPEEKNDFLEYRGGWKFIPQRDNSTLILYSIRTKTKNNPLPFLEEGAARDEMPKTLEEFKKALVTST